MQAAFTLMPFSLAVIAGSVLSRPLAARLPDQRLCSLGLGGIAARNLVLAITAGRVAGLVAGVVVAGAGLGIAAVAAPVSAPESATPSPEARAVCSIPLLSSGLLSAWLRSLPPAQSPAHPLELPSPGTAGAATAGITGLIMLTERTGGGSWGTTYA
jgi:hypothetical protein